MSGTSTIRRPRWLCGVFLVLSFLCFAASFVLSLLQRDNSLAFGTFGLVLALWSSLLDSPRGVCAKDVLALVRVINPFLRR